MKKKWSLALLSAAMLLSLGWTDGIPASTASAAEFASEPSGTIQHRVYLRATPSSDGEIIRMLEKGEKIKFVSQKGSNYYHVQTSEGTAGYIRRLDKYVTVTSESAADRMNKINLVINTGSKYLGTPYEFGSDRDTTKTFDCSDFTRQIYKEAIGITLPVDSRQQGAWVKDHSKVITKISDLRPGDLVFFMNYKGSSDHDYQGINPSKERITHVAIYIGNGQIMHTYSAISGGVRKDSLSGNWSRRFLYGGSIIN
ncbi:cell wall-associated NlpC family hydrolase [Paenibacillus shirakamiensis]|uniref:Cell wall-associated NlpC family hydrolase n=1 Tax=Paenibacillus shirakamiensis TaxID=1265935 RepID=A0ABS4JN56_9BACL|nr:C40 family peptidase [Paenibacillus shirakamiensis]MBP2002451.1 cell wall-associated NlpC family hydrolase [Paenibacillus shirakamiensis]